MAIAKTVLEVEPTNLNWLTLEDSDGKVWRYVRGERCDQDSPVHVDHNLGFPAIRAVLARDSDGEAVLRRDGPGLPERIVVNHASQSSSGLQPVHTFWVGKIEYHLERRAE